MIDLIVMAIDQFFAKDIFDEATLEDGIPETAYRGELPHAVIWQLKLMHEARYIEIVILQPAQFFELNPAKNSCGVILEQISPFWVDIDHTVKRRTSVKDVGQGANCFIIPGSIFRKAAGCFPRRGDLGFSEKASQRPIGHHLYELKLAVFYGFGVQK